MSRQSFCIRKSGITGLKEIQEQKEWAIKSQRYERAADLRQEEAKLLEELKLLTDKNS